MNEECRRTTIFQWNANTLRTKMGDFRKLVAEFKFPVLQFLKDTRMTHTDSLAMSYTAQNVHVVQVEP